MTSKTRREVAFAMIMVVPNMILAGFVLRSAWAWFLVPLGVPSVGIAQALGLSLIVRWLTTSPPVYKETRETIGAAISAVVILIVTLVVWGMAALLHWFMVR